MQMYIYFFSSLCFILRIIILCSSRLRPWDTVRSRNDRVPNQATCVGIMSNMHIHVAGEPNEPTHVQITNAYIALFA